MMESINKNTEVVGVSDALKSLATKKLSPMNSTSINPPLMKQNQVVEDTNDLTITDNKITINSSSSIDTARCEKNLNDIEDEHQTCGWFNFRPKYLEYFMNPKWALIFLCLAGAVQGNYYPIIPPCFHLPTLFHII